jgi:hypothetical protein
VIDPVTLPPSPSYSGSMLAKCTALSTSLLQLQFTRQATVSARGTAVVVDGCTLLLTPLRHTGKWAVQAGR